MQTLLEQSLQDLINFIKTVSPVIWETLVRQIYNDAITCLFWALVCGIAAFVLFKIGKKFKKSYEKRTSYNGEDIIYTFAYVGAWISVVLIPILISTGIRMLINPNYYAITNIIHMFTGK